MSTTDKDFPTPLQPFEDWIAGLAAYGKPIAFPMFEAEGRARGESHFAWLIDGSRRITEGIRHKMFEISMSEDRVNHYALNEGALTFWANGQEQGMSNREILDGWLALSSMEDDGNPDE